MGMLQKKENKGLTYYEVMHGNRKIAEINTRGEAVILALQFFPYDLYLEEERDFDTLINNMNNFYYWCASRVLSLDRKYAKEILTVSEWHRQRRIVIVQKFLYHIIACH